MKPSDAVANRTGCVDVVVPDFIAELHQPPYLVMNFTS